MGRTPIAPGTRSKKGGRQLPLQASDEVKFLYDIAWILRNQGGLLGQLVDGSTTTGTVVNTGVQLLNGAEVFNSNSVPNCRSVSLTIITAGATGLSIATDTGSETVNATGFTIKWAIDKPSDLKIGSVVITNTDTVAIVSYTYTS